MKHTLDALRTTLIKLTPDHSGSRRLLKRIYRLLPRGLRDSYLLEASLETFGQTENVRFIQIGANDGVHGDPLSPYVRTRRWHGLMIEPNPVMFDALQANHAASQSTIAYENVAIGAHGNFVLYWSKDWPGAASTDRLHVEKHLLSPGSEILEQEVTMITFDELLARHPEFSACQILLIDTEGWDGKIVQSIDFSRFRCDLLIFEHIHVAVEELAATYAHLSNAGYPPMQCQNDTVAINSRTQNTRLQAILRKADRI